MSGVLLTSAECLSIIRENKMKKQTEEKSIQYKVDKKKTCSLVEKECRLCETTWERQKLVVTMRIMQCCVYF